MENYKNNYEKYYDELISLDAVFGNFRQFTFGSNLDLPENFPLINNEMYTKLRSLLFVTETEYFAEFANGKPKMLAKYMALIVVGSSENMHDPIGIVPINDFGINLIGCHYYTDYLVRHPLNIVHKIYNDMICHSSSYNVLENKYWCTKCNGSSLSNASDFFDVIQKTIEFSKMPRNSILYITKISNNIDYNNQNDLIKVKNFLIMDKRKIDSIQERINDADEKIKAIVETIQIQKKFNEEKIQFLLSSRGGTMDEYLNIIKEINQKIINLNR